MADGIARQLVALGLKVEVRPTNRTGWLDSLLAGSVDGLLTRITFEVHGTEVTGLTNTAFIAYHSTRLDELAGKLASAPAGHEREWLYTRVEALLLQELPIIPIATVNPRRSANVLLVRKGVHGLSIPATGIALWPPRGSVAIGQTRVETKPRTEP